ncbi:MULTISPECIES: HD domain-containing phosphohydrolase [unclassified Oceanispirochaeta]|uniref:HD domain-containing phosphohydrolase n=1 Tax=unclassified Oceanispirochaeta TaxID=2635722 RepID=UPI000E09DE90|nr:MULTISPECIES: HD domain-containing phosphohydrolase [unclassified Oceanispirochaeta]MBF9016436.1 HD domain-containing protein [Oceanispirochaeta sp. M2]NPD72898.1 HD domain-containing protein [Oceanispirochaeta sp. M1]RDG31475.1 HD domain-containing protein [Oceanispirochaeta sp. M1]
MTNQMKKILQIDKDLNKIQDLDILLERILFYARDAVCADAGSIYIKDGNELEIKYAQNDTLQKELAEGQKLGFDIFRIPVNEKTISGYVAAKGTHLNIRDMYKIPEERPYSFNTHFDEVSGYKTVSSLTFPLVTNQGDVLGVLQLLNAKTPKENITSFKKGDEPFVLHFASTATVALQRARMTRTLLLRMIQMAELRDPKETGAHVNRVGSYSCEIYEAWARRRNIPDDTLQKQKDTLRMAAMLHDVGKVGISDLILKKPGRFNDDEYEIMKSHTYVGARLFADEESDLDSIAKDIAISHHENWDGSGYPGDINWADSKPDEILPSGKGLKGEEIPLYARIVALADVFDALSSRRVYKEAWTEDDVLNEIKVCGGCKFDPELVDIFFEILPILKQTQRKYPDQAE